MLKSLHKKLQSNGGDCNKLYVTKLREIDLWLFHKEVTGSNPNIFKNVSDMIEDNPEALEETNRAAPAQHIKGDIIEVKTEVKMAVREIDEYDTVVGEEDAL